MKDMARAKTKAKPVRRKKASARTKHIRVQPGQTLNIHVLGARGKEISCWTAQADAGGTVVLQTPAEGLPVVPAAEPAPAVTRAGAVSAGAHSSR
jgi:hypothetical protein